MNEATKTRPQPCTFADLTVGQMFYDRGGYPAMKVAGSDGYLAYTKLGYHSMFDNEIVHPLSMWPHVLPDLPHMA